MRVAYFDLVGGASGNMILGAMLDAGLPLADLQSILSTLPLTGWEFETRPVVKNGLGATWIDVRIEHSHGHRGLSDIETIIDGGSLPHPIGETSKRIFRRLAEAEAQVHRTTVDEIHFHEVGAVDAIVDIVGAAAGLHLLGIEQVRCSPFPVGHGSIHCHHGVLPNPPPATVELSRGIPCRPVDVEAELVTPTGAAVLATVSTEFGHRLPARWDRVGYGAGTKDLPFPNLLRLFIGEEDAAEKVTDPMRPGAVTASEASIVSVLETNIDDSSPQIFEHLMDLLLSSGALDVTLTPLVMKKSRPAVQVTVIARPADRETLSQILLRETSTLGVRMHDMQRIVLGRRMETVQTQVGSVRVKMALDDRGNVVKAIPEYEDCRRLALESHKTLHDVMEMARQAASIGQREALPSTE